MTVKEPFARSQEAHGLNSNDLARMLESEPPVRARDLVSIKELASERGGVSVRTLRRWNKLPDAPKRYRQSRRLMYRRAHVQAWSSATQAHHSGTP